MIKINAKYYNKNRSVDIITVQSVEYDDGIKVVMFNRPNKDSLYKLPIEMFEKNFREYTDE